MEDKKKEAVQAALDAAIKDATFKVEYHEAELAKAQLLLEGLNELKGKA